MNWKNKFICFWEQLLSILYVYYMNIDIYFEWSKSFSERRDIVLSKFVGLVIFQQRFKRRFFEYLKLCGKCKIIVLRLVWIINRKVMELLGQSRQVVFDCKQFGNKVLFQSSIVLNEFWGGNNICFFERIFESNLNFEVKEVCGCWSCCEVFCYFKV